MRALMLGLICFLCCLSSCRSVQEQGTPSKLTDKWELQLSLSADAYELLDLDVHMMMSRMHVNTRKGIKEGNVDIVLSGNDYDKLSLIRQRISMTGYLSCRIYKNGQEY